MAAHRGIAKQMAGSRAFEELSAADQAALAALPAAERNALFAAWQPTEAQDYKARQSELARLVAEVHAQNGRIHALCRFNNDSADVTFSTHAQNKVTVDGFDRHGNAKLDPTAVADQVVAQLNEGN